MALMIDLEDGETYEMKGSAAKPYVLKNTGGVYSCSCPAWRNQSVPIERRTCKHLRKLRGDEAEQERIGSAQALPTIKVLQDGPPLLLAQTWDNARDLTGWWISEKLDGVRAYWDGKQFISRQGNLYHAPDWFIEDLPDTILDGELWIDRKAFQRTVSVVRRQDKSELWKEVRYLVFDAPERGGGFEQRLSYLEGLFHQTPEYAELLPHAPCEGEDHLQEELARIEALGGEGLMVREPGSAYQIGRSDTLLKIKSFMDDEAIVTGHVPGKGKHKGRLGALQVQLLDGTQFSVGTGFSDAQREAPPAVGSVITFRYQELSDGGVPRFPSFLRQRDDSPISQSDIDRALQRADEQASAPRYFIYEDDKSSKFWEVTVDHTDVTVRYGKLGANGTRKTKSFDDPDDAATHALSLIDKKTSKGYLEG